MSIQAVLGSGSGEPSGALAASERVERLEALVAKVEEGPAGFAAALNAAQGGSATTGSEASPSTALASDSASGSSALEPLSGESSDPITAAGSESASGAGGASYVPLIDQAAAQNGLDPTVLYGLVQQESGFDPSASSSAGAEGLTQLMPGTATSLGVSEPLNPVQSIDGGARYLGELLRQFGGNVTDALAAYNAGPGAVERYGGVPPYSETQQYVAKVLENAAAERQSAGGDAVQASAPRAAGPTATGTRA